MNTGEILKNTPNQIDECRDCKYIFIFSFAVLLLVFIATYLMRTSYPPREILTTTASTSLNSLGSSTSSIGVAPSKVSAQ